MAPLKTAQSAMGEELEVEHEELQPMTEIFKLKDLRNSCEKFKSDFEYLQNEKKRHMQTLEQLKQRLGNVEDEIAAVHIDERAAQAKLDAINQSSKRENEILENICLLLGFQLSMSHLLIPYKFDSTLLYENGLDVPYRDVQKLYSLVASYPQRPEIEKIREFLKNSQDLEGVLKSLKQIFVAQLKEYV